jgi:23S rRNA (uridine2552-2'-O)-methyltransferase
MKARTKSKKLNKAWLHDHLTDPYVKLAQKEGYRARAAYKLQQLDEQLHLLRAGQVVVDLGAAPGAWSQYLRRRLKSSQGGLDGLVVALDILPFEPVDGVLSLQGDFRDEVVVRQLDAALAGRPVDVVLSDMAPNLSGIESADAARLGHLLELAVDFAVRRLTPRGTLLAKAFHGSGYSQSVELFKRHFLTVKAIKPPASRGRSAETFLVGSGLKSG